MITFTSGWTFSSVCRLVERALCGRRRSAGVHGVQILDTSSELLAMF